MSNRRVAVVFFALLGCGLGAPIALAIAAEVPAQNSRLQETALIPQGYTEVARAKGDLNTDGIDDIAVIVRPSSGKAEAAKQQVLLFRGDGQHSFHLWKKGETHFIRNHPDFIEPAGFAGMDITKGVLSIRTSTALSAGGWGAGGCSQLWRNEPQGLRLIGLTITDFDRRCACGTTRDTNYLTGTQIETTDKGADGEQLPQEVVTTKKLPAPRILWEQFDYSKACES
jgi:hypothetical protein